MTLLDWLLDSDPAIRWQVLRDLADAPAEIVAAERASAAFTVAHLDAVFLECRAHQQRALISRVSRMCPESDGQHETRLVGAGFRT